MGYSPWGCKELDMTEHTHTQDEGLSWVQGLRLCSQCRGTRLNPWPWTEGPGGLQSIGHKELDMTEMTEHAPTGN